MHELALAQRLVALIVEEAMRAGCAKVETVVVRLGALSHVEPSSLELAFLAASRSTVSDGAVLQIERTIAQARCLSCGTESAVAERGSACPHCGEFALIVAGGDELRLVRLEVS